MGMMFRPRRLVAAVALWVLAATALASGALPPPTSETGYQHVQQRKTVAYDEMLATYDAAIQAAPDDVTIIVARCQFVWRFIDSDYGDWVESAPDEFERCSESIAADHAGSPAAELFALEQMWGQTLVERGEALLETADAWPVEKRRELLSALSVAHVRDNKQRAGELAVEAALLGEHTRVAKAVEHLASGKRFGEATRLLREAPVATDIWQAQERILAALLLPGSDAAQQELERHADAGVDVSRSLRVRVHLQAGDLDAARRLVQDDSEDDIVPDKVRFDLAMASGDYRAAADTVDLTDMDGFFGENLVRFFTLATASPATLLTTPSMPLGLLIVLLLLAALALAPGLVLVPVHYRGLMRRLKGKPAQPLFERAGLRHAWYALALILCVPTVVALLLEPAGAMAMLGGEEVPQAPQLWRMVMWGTVAGLLCALPAFRGWERRELIGDRAALFAAWRVLLAWAVLIGIGLLLALNNANMPGGSETLQTRTVDALASGANETYGPVITLLLVALVVPIFEELLYRGLVLGGLSRHISFGWANSLQAGLFAVSHDDLPRLPFYFALGLLAGWLVKRTGALGPAIALHALNNLLAFGVRM